MSAASGRCHYEAVTTREPQVREEPVGRSYPAGNERLTAMTGAVLLVLFIAECLTLLNIGNLLTLHVFLGMLLLGPVSLKIGSTLWRFTRYYTGSAAYVRKGPPGPLQRVTGPFVILTTVAVLGTGVMLVVEGPGNGDWGRLHHLSFFIWALVIIIHLASYLPKLPRFAVRPGGGRPPPAGRPGHALAAAVRFAGGRPGAGAGHLSPGGQLRRLGQPHPVTAGAWPAGLRAFSQSPESSAARVARAQTACVSRWGGRSARSAAARRTRSNIPPAAPRSRA